MAPYLSAGGTDARHLPGIKVYGFFPYGPSDQAAGYSQLVHGHDERIGVEDLAFGMRFLYELVLRFCKVEIPSLESTSILKPGPNDRTDYVAPTLALDVGEI